VRNSLLPRGVYLLPVLDASTLQPVLVLIDHRHCLIHSLRQDASESGEAAIARAESLLEALDPAVPVRRRH
jgi:hypothetical protein